MPATEILTAFFGVAVLLALAPGPDNLFVMVHAAVHGRWAGMLVVLGLCTGLCVHTVAVALGLAAVFAASATAFSTLKLAGAAYLLYLAWRSFRPAAHESTSGKPAALSRWLTYRRGVIMNLSNPKVAVFFLAFLPQFADPRAGSLAGQFLLLGGLFVVATLLVFGSIAVFAGAVGGFLRRSPGAQRWLNRAAGAIFVALAVQLVVSDR